MLLIFAIDSQLQEGVSTLLYEYHSLSLSPSSLNFRIATRKASFAWRKLPKATWLWKNGALVCISAATRGSDGSENQWCLPSLHDVFLVVLTFPLLAETSLKLQVCSSNMDGFPGPFCEDSSTNAWGTGAAAKSPFVVLVFFLSFLILLLDLKQQTIGSWEDEDTMVLLCQEWRYKQEPIHWTRSYPCDIAWW